MIFGIRKNKVIVTLNCTILRTFGLLLFAIVMVCMIREALRELYGTGRTCRDIPYRIHDFGISFYFLVGSAQILDGKSPLTKKFVI